MFKRRFCNEDKVGGEANAISIIVLIRACLYRLVSVLAIDTK